VLKRVFLQRATHLGTQTEYLLAKHPENDPLDTNATWIQSFMDMRCKIWARMSCKQTQTSRGHNSAPQATLTPRLELNRSP